jgi:ABC-type nitrate/sulfonate/bicarbonate transport system permease component
MRGRLWGPVIFVVMWELIAASGLVNRLILPSVPETMGALIRSSRGIAVDTSSSLGRLALGFAIGSPLGVVVGTLFGASRRSYLFFELVIDFFRSLPVVTLFPLAMVAFGLGDPAKVALVAWTVFLLTVVNTLYGIRQVPQTRILAARSLGARGWKLLWKVSVPSATPTVIAGIRLSLSLGLVVVVVTEMFTGTNQGLGKRIFDSGLVYETPMMYAAIIVTGTVGYALNAGVVALERRLTHWSGR